MITISCVRKPTQEFTLLTGKTYSVGRKVGDLTFENDHSVSRNHATISVDHPLANVSNPSLTPSVVVTDLGSKFGTYVNDGIDTNQTVSMREPNTLGNGDRFRFGLQWNEYRIKYTPLITVPSGVINDGPKLKDTICQLAGHLLPEWKDGCDYLITETLSLTVKAVCALLSAKHIVTSQYFHDYLDAVKNSTKLPSPADYLPAFVEKLPQPFSFSPNPARTKLFDSKVFLFATPKQVKKIGVAVRCAGGAVDLITSVSPTLLKAENTLIVLSQGDPQQMDSATCNAVETYKSAKKRIIPDSEIGLAAVYASIDRYCNPYFNITKQIFSKSLTSQTQQSIPASITVIPETQQSAAETQRTVDYSQSQISESRNIIDETVNSSQSQSQAHSNRPAVISVDSQSQSQPMEFAVPTPRIKEEKEDESEFVSFTLAPMNTASTSTRSTRKADPPLKQEGGSKRRRDGEGRGVFPPPEDEQSQVPGPSRRREPSPKRPRNESPKKTTRYTAASSKALSSIFGMSDDEDEEEEELLPPPPPPPVTTRTTRRAAAVAAVTVTATPVEPIVDQIAPHIREIANMINEEANTEGRSQRTRSASKSKSPVKPEPSSIESENSKRKQPEERSFTEEQPEPGTSKKRRVEEIAGEIKRSNSSDGFTSVPALQSDRKALTKKEEHIPEEDIKPLPFIYTPLMRKMPPKPVVQDTVNSEGNGKRCVYNFKAFKKVLPLCMNSGIMNNSTGSGVANARRNSISIILRPYNCLGFIDSEPMSVTKNRKPNRDRDRTPERNTNISTVSRNKNRNRAFEESMDTSTTVDISPAKSIASTSTTLRRSGRGAGTTLDTQDSVISSVFTTPAKRGTRSTAMSVASPSQSPAKGGRQTRASSRILETPEKRETRSTTSSLRDSPPPFFDEEGDEEEDSSPVKIEDEWAF